MKKFYEHKQHRLKNYNYSSNGSYFITICVKNKECLLGDITVAVDAYGDRFDAHGDRKTDNINDLICLKSSGAKMVLSDFGHITKKYIETSKSVYQGLSVDNYVIMPNHIHMILSICNDVLICTEKPCHDLIPTYVSSLKTLITKEIGFSIFQRNFHDHIIRNEDEYEKIWDYIDTNPSSWVADRFYMY